MGLGECAQVARPGVAVVRRDAQNHCGAGRSDTCRTSAAKPGRSESDRRHRLDARRGPNGIQHGGRGAGRLDFDLPVDRDHCSRAGSHGAAMRTHG
jgi:hypothetical protein